MKAVYPTGELVIATMSFPINGAGEICAGKYAPFPVQPARATAPMTAPVVGSKLKTVTTTWAGDWESVQRLLFDDEMARDSVVYWEGFSEAGKILNREGGEDVSAPCKGMVTSSLVSLVMMYTRFPVGCVTICSALVTFASMSVRFKSFRLESSLMLKLNIDVAADADV